jgi:hypothetical protein
MVGAVTSLPIDITTASVNERINVLLEELQTGSVQGMQIYTVQVDFCT